MLHRTAEERYEKLKKVFSRLMVRFNRDDLDDSSRRRTLYPNGLGATVR
jgi:hypothetical protein